MARPLQVRRRWRLAGLSEGRDACEARLHGVDVFSWPRPKLGDAIERRGELGLPAVQVLAAVGIDSLVSAAMMLYFVHAVPGQADRSGALAAGALTATAPATGCLSVPVMPRAFDGLGPGLPASTESSLMRMTVRARGC
jgi:hypothetical protein